MIAIPNMDYPKFCDGCDLVKYWVNGSFYCMADGEELNLEVDRRNDCPLIEIVQCKDCKWGDTGIDEEGKPFWKCLGIHYGGTKPTDFCSYGERREE